MLWPVRTITLGKQAGVARPSLIGKLLDDYDISAAVDLEHEYDLKMVGAVMYFGKRHSPVSHDFLTIFYFGHTSGSRDGEANCPIIHKFSRFTDRQYLRLQL